METQNSAGRTFNLSRRNIDVWTVRIDPPKAVAERFVPYLGADEKERAARFQFEQHRNSFVIAHGVLRILLGHYLNVSPISIQFKFGAKGKPALAAPADVDFNMSHSGGLAVFAFMAGCEVGVDVEHLRPLQDMHRIASRFFCSEEAAELMSLAAEQREQGFYLCWTRKEAYIKAIGDGLSAPLDDFRVTLRPGQPARFLHIAHDTSAAEAWKLHDLQLGPNYSAALAYCETERPVTLLPMIDPAEFLSPGVPNG
jgi:4'-phosphopantetheinyl transferase